MVDEETPAATAATASAPETAEHPVTEEIVREASALPAGQIKQGILDGVAAWRNGPPTDDVSLMLAHVR